VTGSTGLRRFVPATGPATAPATAAPTDPAAPPASAAPAAPPVPLPPGRPARQTGAPPDGSEPVEKCEMCATEIPAEHSHVADLEASSLVCACRACSLLFTHARAGRGRYRAVPDRYRHDPVRQLTVAQWDEFEIPVGLAFFFRSSQRAEGEDISAFYPSPAGATESTLNLAAWGRLTAEYPLLAAVEADVEAVLITRTDAGVEYFLVPIDACYELAGRMRLHWRGFDGGTEARDAIAGFLATVRSRSRVFNEERPDA
jgi:hypothetical protein